MAWKINRTRGPWQTEAKSERRYRDGSRRPLMIEVEPLCVVYRAKGTRQSFRLTHERLYQLCVQAHVDSCRAAKRRRRRRPVRRGVLALSGAGRAG